MEACTLPHHCSVVPQVMKADEDMLMNHKSLVVTVNQHGVVLTVNTASKTLFGFPPANLIGKHLSSFVTSFEAWRKKFGETDSLLSMLAVLAQEHPGRSFRTGVHVPGLDVAASSTPEQEVGQVLLCLKQFASGNSIWYLVSVRVVAQHGSDNSTLDVLGAAQTRSAVSTVICW